MPIMRHKKWNISYETVETDKLINLSAEQAASMAAYFSGVVRCFVETEFLLWCHENNVNVPDELKNAWPKTEDYTMEVKK